MRFAIWKHQPEYKTSKTPPGVHFFSLQLQLETCNSNKNNFPPQVFLKVCNEANDLKLHKTSNVLLVFKNSLFAPFCLCFGTIFSWLVSIKVGSSSKVNFHLICKASVNPLQNTRQHLNSILMLMLPLL